MQASNEFMNIAFNYSFEKELNNIENSEKQPSIRELDENAPDWDENALKV